MRILQVEDHVATAKAVAALLQRSGYELDTASSGEQAIEFAGINDYELILLDLMLPDMSGFELATKLRKSGVAAPVLFQTGLNEVRREVERGLFDRPQFLFKPFNKSQLLGEIEKIVGPRPEAEDRRADKRRHERTSILKRGRVVRPSQFDCLILNMSKAGAAIQVPHKDIRIPDRFSLAMRGFADRECEVRWRKGDKAGVAFVAKAELLRVA